MYMTACLILGIPQAAGGSASNCRNNLAPKFVNCVTWQIDPFIPRHASAALVKLSLRKKTRLGAKRRKGGNRINIFAHVIIDNTPIIERNPKKEVGQWTEFANSRNHTITYSSGGSFSRT